MRRGRPMLDTNSRASSSTTLLLCNCIVTTCIYTVFYCAKSKNSCACSIKPGHTLVLSLSPLVSIFLLLQKVYFASVPFSSMHLHLNCSLVPAHSLLRFTVCAPA